MSKASYPLKLPASVKAAAARLAKGEVFAGHHTGNAQPFGEQFDHEIFRRRRGEFGVEIEHQHCIGPGLREQALALFERGQPEPGDMRREEAHGMRIEGGYYGGLACSLGLPDGITRYRLMAEVEAIEIAERNNCPAQSLGHHIAGR